MTPAAALPAAALLAAALAAAPGGTPHLPAGWSYPSVLGTSGVDAAPAAAVDAAGTLHLFYLDRDGQRGVARWLTLSPDGRDASGPHRLGPADPRAGAPAVAVAGDRDLVVAWVAPAGDGVRVLAARVRGDRTTDPRPIGPPAEDAGPVAVAAAGGRIVAAWSQAAGGRREVWVWAGLGTEAFPLAPGDAPGLSWGPDGPLAVWWERTGFDTYRLVTAPATRPSARPLPLTGNVATSRLRPPAVAHDAAGRAHVLFGVETRGFGPAAARVLGFVVEPSGQVSPRRALAPRSPYAADVTAVPWRGGVAAAWADLRAGRSGTTEIYLALVTPARDVEARLTYTLASSRRPALTTGPGPVLYAAWLEVTPGGRFALAMATTARPAPRRFLLGIPELDVGRPGEALAFGALAAVGTLPYALLLTVATGLLTVVALGVGRAVFDDTRWWRWLARSPGRGLLAALIVALGTQRLASAVLLPGVSWRPEIPAAILLLGLAWWRLVRPGERGLLTRVALVLGAVFLASAALAFAWSAGTLSRLAT